MNKVLIIGSRYWTDEGRIYSFLAQQPKGTQLIHGGGAGAEALAKKVTKDRGMKEKEFKSDVKKHGRAAVAVRNHEMLTKGKPDLVAYFHNNLSKNQATANLISEARGLGVSVVNGARS